jgi:DNA-binding LacI/PurR family transcriptional regulator
LKERVTRLNKNAKRPGRRDVAKLAGVSLTAVTHALNNTPGIRMNEETREKIKRTAKSIDYRPSFIGKALVSGRNYTVGLLQPSSGSFVNIFHQALYRALADTMNDDDYNMLLLFRSDDFKYMRPIEQGRLDAMIVMQSDTDTPHVEKIISSGIPTVILNVDYPLQNNAKAFCVHSDYVGFVENLLNEFTTSTGRRMLAIIDPDNSYTEWRICKAIMSKSAELLSSGACVTIIKPDWEDIRRQVKTLLKMEFKWDSLFINSYAQAKVMLEETATAGLVKGRDFRIWAADHNRNSILPKTLSCTTFLQDMQGLAAHSWEGLKQIMNGQEQIKNCNIPYLKISEATVWQNTKTGEKK